MYQSQSDKERFCRHYTVKREHALSEKLWQPRYFQDFAQFFALNFLTVVSTHKTLDNKVLDQICRILTIRFSEIRQQIRVTRELLNQTALKPLLLKKQINITHVVLEFCTGRFFTSAPWDDEYLGKPKPRRLSKLTVVVVVVVSSMRLLQLKNYPTFSSLIFGYCYALLLALLVLSQCVEEQTTLHYYSYSARWTPKGQM